MTWEVNAILCSRKVDRFSTKFRSSLRKAMMLSYMYGGDGHVVFDYETAGWSGS
jgi:hypothetical protein